MTRRPIPSALSENRGFDATSRVWVGGHDRKRRRALEAWLVNATRPPDGPIDVAFLTPCSPEEAVYFANKIAPRLVSDGAIWVTHWAKEPPRPVLDEPSESPELPALVDAMRAIGYEQEKAFPLPPQHGITVFRRVGR